jgi:NAD(P)-dependent dehydrogenase (short-subunit alcohol dehydrogenase family)
MTWCSSARRIDGMTVAITGASAGIGAALALQLAAAGATVVAGARRHDRLTELARQSPRIVPVVMDVDRADDCARLIETALAQPGKRLDVLVCNAGYGLALPIEQTTDDDWLAILRTNVLGTAACIRAALPHLRQQSPIDGWRGQVQIVSSALARRGRPDGGAYSATKAAQLSLAEALRVELAADAIAVTSVHPVGTETEFTTAIRRGTWVTGAREPRQTAEHVAATMIAAMRRPRPEVWPHRLSRAALALNGFWPSLFDRYFQRRLVACQPGRSP